MRQWTSYINRSVACILFQKKVVLELVFECKDNVLS